MQYRSGGLLIPISDLSRLHAPALGFALFVCITGAGWGQQTSTRPVQLPLAPQAQTGTSIRQTATPSATSSVDTLSTQTSVQGSYSGSMVGPAETSDHVMLTLQIAVSRGLKFNLGMLDAGAESRQAQAQLLAARSALTPNVSASVSEIAAKADLAAQGFSSSLFAGLGFSFPTTAGPFHYYDLRGSLQHNFLDITAIENYRSARQSASASHMEARQAREEVVLAVTSIYLQLMATVALIEEQKTEVQFAEASYQQARAQADSGTKAPIDATRSLVELQTQKQRLQTQLGDLQKQKNSLARMIGLPLGIDIDISEKLEAAAPNSLSVDEAVLRACSQRQDLKSAETQLGAAELARKAAGAEHLPTGTVSGYYGLQGTNPNQGSGVFQASASLSIPIFDGGRIHSDVIRADAVVTQRRAQFSNERQAVELDVRNAYIDRTIADQQVVVAESNRKLALATLQQSQDRFSVGVADEVEVVNSQEALASADHDYVSSMFSQNLARVALAHAMGDAETDSPHLLKGNDK